MERSRADPSTCHRAREEVHYTGPAPGTHCGPMTVIAGDENMKSVETQANWAQVVYFKVYRDDRGEVQPAHFKIFNNGFQQCPVKVDIVVADASGNPVPFPDESVPSLIDYDRNEQLIPSSIPITDSPAWTYTETKRDFLWDESIVPAAAEVPQDETATQLKYAVQVLSPDLLLQKRSYTF